MPTRILLADDHEIVRQGLRLLLQREGLEVIGEAANGQEAIRLASETCPDVAVLDYGMPLLNGIGAAREIMQVCPRTKVILLTMHTDDHYVLEALRMGIKGFVVKSQAPADLVRAIQEVQRGMVYLSPRVRVKLNEKIELRVGVQLPVVKSLNGDQDEKDTERGREKLEPVLGQ